MLWAGLILGFFGSLHCIGMCGPIALALPLDRTSKVKTWLGGLSYNSGRVLTYALMGGILGQIGQAFQVIGWQRWASLIAGGALLLYVLLTYLFKKQVISMGPWMKIVAKVGEALRKQLGRKSLKALFGAGMLNGLLPCGMVYFALVGAVATGSVFSGAIYMALFGLGTIPALLAINLLGASLSGSFRSRINRLIPYVMTIFAVLFILRGLALDIPYISPALDPTSTSGSCCH